MLGLTDLKNVSELQKLTHEELIVYTRSVDETVEFYQEALRGINAELERRIRTNQDAITQIGHALAIADQFDSIVGSKVH